MCHLASMSKNDNSMQPLCDFCCLNHCGLDKCRTEIRLSTTKKLAFLSLTGWQRDIMRAVKKIYLHFPSKLLFLRNLFRYNSNCDTYACKTKSHTLIQVHRIIQNCHWYLLNYLKLTVTIMYDSMICAVMYNFDFCMLILNSVCFNPLWYGLYCISSHIARFMGPTWHPPGDDRAQVGPMLAPWTLLSGLSIAFWIRFAMCQIAS